MRRARKLVPLLALVGALALATTPVLASHISLSFFEGGDARARWTREFSNGGSFGIELTTRQPTGSAYAGVAISGASGLKMSDVSALGFDVHTGFYLGAGAPRFSVLLDTDGDSGWDQVLWPSALYCVPDSGSWERADFLTCPTIYGSGGGPKSWADWKDEYGDPTIVGIFLIQDEGPATAYLDNVTVNETVGEPRENSAVH